MLPAGAGLELMNSPTLSSDLRKRDLAGGLHQEAGGCVDVVLLGVRQHQEDDARVLEHSAAVLYPSLWRPAWPSAPGPEPYSARLSQIPSPFSGRSSKSVISSSDAGDRRWGPTRSTASPSVHWRLLWAVRLREPPVTKSRFRGDPAGLRWCVTELGTQLLHEQS